MSIDIIPDCYALVFRNQNTAFYDIPKGYLHTYKLIIIELALFTTATTDLYNALINAVHPTRQFEISNEFTTV